MFSWPASHLLCPGVGIGTEPAAYMPENVESRKCELRGAVETIWVNHELVAKKWQFENSDFEFKF